MGLFQHYFENNLGKILVVLAIIFYFAVGFPTNVGGEWHFWNHLKEDFTGTDRILGRLVTVILITVCLGLLYMPYQTWKRTQK